MPTEDPWYELVTEPDELMQGDLLPNCSIVRPYFDKTDNKIHGDEKIFDVVILSQSCELAEAQAELFVTCNYITMSEFKQRLQDAHAKPESLKSVELDLGKGRRVGYHPLNPCILVGYQMAEPLVVDFHNVFGVPLEILRLAATAAGSGRLRLRPPYREHLSQAFAQFFAKVALPVGYYDPVGKQQRPMESVLPDPATEAPKT